MSLKGKSDVMLKRFVLETNNQEVINVLQQWQVNDPDKEIKPKIVMISECDKEVLKKYINEWADFYKNKINPKRRFVFEHEITQFGIGYKQACKDITSLMHVSEEEKCVELTPQIEEKITKETIYDYENQDIGIIRPCSEQERRLIELIIQHVFQKLKEQLM
jgi:hypothetical protein